MKSLKTLLQEVTAGIKAWANANFSLGTHVHGNITNDGKLATASKALITDSNKNITTSSITDTELGYLSGVTSSVQTQLNAKAADSGVVHTTGNETVDGVKTFSESKIGLGITSFTKEQKSSTTYEMTASDFYLKFGFFKITQFKAGTTSAPRGNNGDYDLIGMSTNTAYGTYLCTTPRNDLLWYGKFWDSVWQGWKEVVNCESTQTITGEKTFQRYVSVYSNTLTRGTNPSENAYCTLGFKDSGGNGTARILRWVNSDGYNGLTIECCDAQVTTEKTAYFQLAYDTQGNGYSKLGGDNVVGFIPGTDNSVGLGTTTNRWKTLNGVNPGALSLPNSNAQDTSWIGDLTIKDGSNYNLKTFALNGWITINIPNTAGNLVVVNNGCGQIVTNEASGITGNNCAVFMPVVANVQISILLVLQTGESVKTAIFAPCLGNV